jgi:hypothetical protein
VLQEVRSLEPVLLAPDAATQPVLTPANPAIHVLLKESDGHRYLIVASDSRRAEETVLKMEGVADAQARRVDRGAERATQQVIKGQLTLALPPLAAAVYELMP